MRYASSRVGRMLAGRGPALASGLILAALAVFAVAQYDGPGGLWRAAGCVVSRHAGLTPAYRFEGFFPASTVPQTVDLAGAENCELRRDEQGRAFLAPRDPGRRAVVRITLKKEFDDYVFFPRVSKGSAVLVCEASPENVLFRLEGSDAGWTPLGRRYLLDLSSCEHGAAPHQVDVGLLVVLRGPWAQLWLPADAVFFR